MSVTCPICNNEIADGEASCAFCGYRMGGTTQEFKPISVDNAGSQSDDKVVKIGELRVVRGPQTGIAIALKEGRLSIGRDPQSDIFLNDMTVSRRHAAIETDWKGCVIYDTNSYNGVWVNDKMVEACLLKSGDVIQIGAFCLVYRQRS
ncbi:MAG: FHA domain-containing protein [Eggerthellaceae bacterium]|nr:FHA domain-containing protein [Eggerthellaceae bacterium]